MKFLKDFKNITAVKKSTPDRPHHVAQSVLIYSVKYTILANLIVEFLKEIYIDNPHVLFVVVHRVDVRKVTQLQRSSVFKHLGLNEVDYVGVIRLQQPKSRTVAVNTFDWFSTRVHHHFLELLDGHFVVIESLAKVLSYFKVNGFFRDFLFV